MKLDHPHPAVLDGLTINNGDFSIRIDRNVFCSTMERKQHSPEQILGLWRQFEKFAAEVEVSRAYGFALGSTDPVGALDDQIHRFNLVASAHLTISDGELRAMIDMG